MYAAASSCQGLSGQSHPILVRFPIPSQRTLPHTDYVGVGMATMTKRAHVDKDALEEEPRGATNDNMTPKLKVVFDPKLFLSKVGKGRTISEYRKNDVVFSQGDRGDAIFYIQKGKVKLTVVSNAGKEAVIVILGPGDFLGE